MSQMGLSSPARRLVALATMVLVTAGSSTIAATQDGESSEQIRLLVSRPAGQENGIWWADLSGNGRTAFVWTRDELLPELERIDGSRLFAVDVATGQVRLVSGDPRLTPEAVSTDGRFIVAGYEMSDRNVTAVVVDTVTSVIHALGLDEPLTWLREATISGDGSTIAFAATTGSGDTLSDTRLFIADVATGAVTEPLAGADGDLFDVHLNGDGTVLALATYAENLDMPPGDRGSDAVVYDRVRGTLEYAYATVDGGIPDGQSAVNGISADGSKVLIRSGASNLEGAQVAEPTSSFPPLLYDRSTGTATRVDGPEVASLSGAYIADHSSDLSVLAVTQQSTSLAIRYDVAERRSTSLYGAAVAPDGDLWSGGLDPISLDDSGEIAVLLSNATNLGPDRDMFTDAFIVGAPTSDPTGQVYVPPVSPLPPNVFVRDDDTVTPPAIPAPAPPTTSPPSTLPDSGTATPDPADQVGGPSVPSRSVGSSALFDLGCRIDEALRLDVLPCGRPVTPFDRFLGALLISYLIG